MDWSPGDKREEGGVIQNWYIFEWWLFLGGGGGDHTSSGCLESLLFLYTYLMSFHFLLSFFLCLCFSSLFLRPMPQILAQSHVTCTYITLIMILS